MIHLLYNDLICLTCAYCLWWAMWDARTQASRRLIRWRALEVAICDLCVYNCTIYSVRIVAGTGPGGKFAMITTTWPPLYLVVNLYNGACGQGHEHAISFFLITTTTTTIIVLTTIATIIIIFFMRHHHSLSHHLLS